MGMTERAKIGATDAASAKAILFELQVEQHHHDETYHREIARLSLHQRLNHMALHFAKYVGKIAAATSIVDTIPAYTDTLIIGISTTNILNEEIWNLVGRDQEFPGLLSFGRALSHDVKNALGDQNELLRETSIAAGRIAAACEKIDHLEEIAFRSEVKLGLKNLLTLSLAVLASHGIDPAIAIRDRLQSVKSRLKLHGRI
jgi:hypothetical protein